MVNRLLQWLGRDVSASSLGVFRATFGAVMVYEASYFLKPSFFFWPERGANLVQRLYTGEHLHWHFHYPGFSWIRPLPEPWTSALFGLFLVAAVLVAVGWWYRVAIVALWAAFSYIILMEATWYLNHFYLGALLAFLLAWMPADRRWSLRRLWARLAKGESKKPLAGQAPFWCVFLLRFQLFVMYFYAGIAKLTPDWLAGEPVRMWLGDAFVGRRLEWLVGAEAMVPIRRLLGQEAVVYFIAYGGLVFDLLIGPMLLWRRTRWLALMLAAFFHGTNFLLFDIGAFPVMAFLLTLIFFDPDWPDRLWERGRRLTARAVRTLRAAPSRQPAAVFATAASRAAQNMVSQPSPANGGLLIESSHASPSGNEGALAQDEAGDRAAGGSTPRQVGRFPSGEHAPAPSSGSPMSPVGAVAIAVWIAVQLLLPLRHFAIAGNVHWTGEGSRFSWHMMLRHLEPGYLEYRIVDPELIRRAGDRWEVDWSQWQFRADESSWHEVDARQLDLATMPELFIAYEPIVGERLFYNPHARDARLSDGTSSAPAEQLIAMWQAAFHRRPRVENLVRLSQSLEQLRDAAVRTYRQRGVPPPAAVRRLALAAQLAQQLETTDFNEQQLLTRTAQLQTVLEELRSYRSLRRALFDALDTAPPWAVVGGRAADQLPTVFVVRDRALERRRTGSGVRQISRRGPTGDMPAFVDLRRLLPIEMAPLPQALIVWNAQGEPRIVWNYAAELHPLQCRTMRSFAAMQHEYAQRIAQRWQALYGRRPRIYVQSSLALNHHPMQPLIDPTVDLASEPRYVWRHNRWILPMKQRAESADANGSQPASATAP